MFVTYPVFNHLNKHLTLICFMWFQRHWLKFCLTVVDETYIIYIYIQIGNIMLYIYILILISMLMHVLLLMSFARINCCSFTGIGEQHNFLERKKMLRMQVPVPSWVSVGFGRKKNLGSTSDLRSFYQ